jgi:hypothetical protein
LSVSISLAMVGDTPVALVAISSLSEINCLNALPKIAIT